MIMVFLQRIWHMTQKHILDRHKQILLNQYFVPKWWEINDILFLLLKEMIETSLKASWIQQLSINKSNKKYRIFYKYFFLLNFMGFTVLVHYMWFQSNSGSAINVEITTDWTVSWEMANVQTLCRHIEIH